MSRVAPILFAALTGVGAAQAQPAALPKVSVIVAGDPDSAIRRRAVELTDAISEAGCARLPEDSLLAAALRGQDGADDGLTDVRAARRRLGLSEADDAPVLASLGRVAGASRVLVLRPGAGTVEIVVFDTTSSLYVTGRLRLPAPDEAVLRFVCTRVGDVLPPRTATPAPADAAPGSDVESAAATGAAAGQTGPRAAAPTDTRLLPVAQEGPASDLPPPSPGWLDGRWPWLLVGAAVVGGAVIAAMLVDDDEAGPPTLRIRAVP